MPGEGELPERQEKPPWGVPTNGKPFDKLEFGDKYINNETGISQRIKDMLVFYCVTSLSRILTVGRVFSIKCEIFLNN